MKKSKIKASPSPKINNENSSFEDFMVLLFLSAFLIIDFLPYFKTYEIIAPQFLYLSVLNILIALYIYSNPLLHNYALLKIFKKSYALKIYLLFIVLCGVSIFSAKNKSLSILSFAELLVVCSLVLNFGILLFNRLHLIYKIVFLVGVSAFFQAGIALYNFEIMVSSKSLLEGLQSEFLKGNTGNINILSASLLFKIPFIYFGLVHFKNWKRWFLAFSLLFGTTIIFLINARTTLLSLILITICFISYQLIQSTEKKKAAIKLLLIIMPILIFITVVNIVFKQANLTGRYSSTTERLKQINVEDGSANARLSFYKNAIQLIKTKPVFGIGLGNYRVESIPYEDWGASTLSLHAHNDFLELTAETGLLNGILYFLFFGLILILNIKKILSTTQQHVKNVAFLTILLLIIYGIDSIFNFPFYRPTMQICFCLILAFTHVNGAVLDSNQINKKTIFLGLIIFSALPVYVTYNAYKTSNLEYLIQTDNINFQPSGVLKGDDVINSKPKFPNVFQSSESYVEYAGIYYFREKKYDLALKYLDSANKINPYLGRPDFYKYLIFTEMGQADSAYKHIKNAFYIKPINDNFFLHAINTASSIKDSTEILKMFATPLKSNKARRWVITYDALKNIGVNKNSLIKFEKVGFDEFPKDSTVTKKINNSKITDFIIKGQGYFASGKNSDALKTYFEGLKIDTTNVYINQNIGFYYFNTNKPNEAIAYFKKALSLPGLTDGKTEYYLGICSINVGQKANACKYFAAAGNYPDAKTKLNLYCGAK